MELLICNSQQHNVKAKDNHKQADIFKVTRAQIFPQCLIYNRLLGSKSVFCSESAHHLLLGLQCSDSHGNHSALPTFLLSKITFLPR